MSRFGKELVEAAEEMAAHMRGEIESYEVNSNPEAVPSEGRRLGEMRIEAGKRIFGTAPNDST